MLGQHAKAFNIVSVHQLRDSQNLLRESKKEGQDLIQDVTFFTLLFLPPTFVAVSKVQGNFLANDTR
jgi:hypothetical protein